MISVDVEAIAAGILRMCDAVEGETRSAVAAAPGVIDFALSQIRVGWPIGVPLSGFVKDQIRNIVMSAVKELAEVIYEAIAMFRLLAKAVGRPSALRAAAATLQTEVIDRAGLLDSSMKSSALQGLSHDHWQSRAKDHYLTAFNEQSRAVENIDEPARMLKHALDDLADSIEKFFDELLFDSTSFAVAALGVSVAIGTAPTGVGPVIGLAITIVGYIMALVSLVSAFTDSANRNADSATRLTTTEALNWPTSTFAQ